MTTKTSDMTGARWFVRIRGADDTGWTTSLQIRHRVAWPEFDVAVCVDRATAKRFADHLRRAMRMLCSEYEEVEQ
jgi:hypothetical protein